MNKVAVASSGDVREGELCPVKVEGRPVLLSRVHGKICAFSARCPHIGFPLTRGKVVNGSIQCPWHGSRFDLSTGRNLDWANAFAGIPMPAWSHGLLALGKRPAPLDMFEASEQHGSVLLNVP